MDYTTLYPAINRYFFEVFVSSIVFCLIFPIYTGIKLYKEYIASKSKGIVAGLLLLSIAFVWLTYSFVNDCKDIPNIVSKNYIVATGTAIGWNTVEDETEPRGFEFQPDDGEKIDLSVLPCPPVHQGDRFEVIYLPNSGIGAIIQILDDSE